ncbi:hypothetical protein ACVMB0_007609 [Bradyrhizobium sp. USDA 4451]
MKPDRNLKLVDEVCGEWQVSIRRACDALELDRSTYHYKSRRSGQAARGLLARTSSADLRPIFPSRRSD